MKAKPNAKMPIQNAKAPGSPPSATGNTYAPSVPISLYREVVNELQSNKTLLEALKTQNQQLNQQNQQLRVEIERVVQSALYLRQIADTHQPIFSMEAEQETLPDLELHIENPTPSVKSSAPTVPTTKKPVPRKPSAQDDPSSQRLFTEQEVQPRRTPQSEQSSEIAGWWLVVVVCLIVVTAFGVGFVIVRPLLPSR
jgi:cobalamin biosynthesis Mg chelatase CobN